MSEEREERVERERRAILPSVALREAFAVMAQDYKAAGEYRYWREAERDGFDFLDYVSRLRGYARGIDLPAGLVPYTTFWLVGGPLDTIYGVSRLRHRLNNRSRLEGGHIGYDVPPSHRNAGNGTELLRQTLAKARDMGIFRVLLTCDETNIASARVIEKNGGRFENQVVSNVTGSVVNRYWINT